MESEEFLGKSSLSHYRFPHKKKRSSIACSRCRERKVRCDAALLGLPCTNCSLDRIACKVQPGRKRPKYIPDTHYKAPLPDYIQVAPEHLANEDLEYIERKGALRLPSPAVRDTLWASYFQLVHPNFPVLDREEMLGALRLDSGAPKISLLLFHSIMLVARLFLDAHEGRCTTAITLQSMFDRARILYDMGWEPDRLTQLQSLLLMSFHPFQYDDPKGSVHMVSRAVSLAYVLGLHRDPTSVTDHPRDISLRKQIWWTIFIRERLTSSDAGLPWIIQEGNHDVPMLTLDDLAQAPLATEDTTQLLDQSDDLMARRQLDLLFIEKAKLAVISGRLVPISVGSPTPSTPSSTDNMPRAHCSAPDLRQLEMTERDLDSWLTNLPIELSLLDHTIQPPLKAGDPFLSSCHATLMLLYRIACHQISCLRWLRVSTKSGEAPEYAMKNLLNATRPIIVDVENLKNGKNLDFVQINAPSIIRPIMLCLMLNRNMPFWMNPFFEFDLIPALFTMIGGSDCYFRCGSSFLQNRIDDFNTMPDKIFIDGSSDVQLNLQFENHTSPSSGILDALSESSKNSDFDIFENNIFDDVLGIPLNEQPQPDTSIFHELMETFDGCT